MRSGNRVLTGSSEDAEEGGERSSFLKRRVISESGGLASLSAQDCEKMMKYDIMDYWKPRFQLETDYLNSTHFSPALHTTLLRWVLSTLIAATVGLLSVLVTGAIEMLTGWRYYIIAPIIDSDPTSKGMGFVSWLVVTLLSCSLALVAGLAVYMHPPAGGSGLPAVICYLNGVVYDQMLSIKTLAFKVISLIACNSCGLPVGAEAPMIHLGAIVGAQTARIPRFRSAKDTRDFSTLGAACGVSAAFGAPIGGLLFVMEEMASHWDHRSIWRMFFSTMVSFIVKAVCYNALLWLLGKEKLGGLSNRTTILFEVDTVGALAWSTIGPAIIVGVVGGVFAAAFTKMNLFIHKLRKKFVFSTARRKLLEPVIATLFYVTLCIILPLMFPCSPKAGTPFDPARNSTSARISEPPLVVPLCGNNTYSPLATLSLVSSPSAIRRLLVRDAEQFLPLPEVGMFFVLYTLGACYISGSGIASGLLVPLIAIGSSYGRVLGGFITDILSFDETFVDLGVFALLGAGAFLGGVTRLTISLTVILVELCGDLHVLLPLMVAILTARWVCDTIHHTSLYHATIEMDAVPFLPSKVLAMDSELHSARDVMCTTLVCLTTKETRATLRTALATQHHSFPVVDCQENKSFLGCVDASVLQLLLNRGCDFGSYEEYTEALRVPTAIDPSRMISYDEEFQLDKLMNNSPWTVQSTFSLNMTYALFRNMGLRHLYVLDGSTVVGVITRKDLVLC